MPLRRREFLRLNEGRKYTALIKNRYSVLTAAGVSVVQEILLSEEVGDNVSTNLHWAFLRTDGCSYLVNKLWETLK
jgi:hypothetical protein